MVLVYASDLGDYNHEVDVHQDSSKVTGLTQKDK